MKNQTRENFVVPSLIVENFSGVKVPLSILGAEIDKMSPPELLKQFEAALNAKSEVRNSIYPSASLFLGNSISQINPYQNINSAL